MTRPQELANLQQALSFAEKHGYSKIGSSNDCSTGTKCFVERHNDQTYSVRSWTFKADNLDSEQLNETLTQLGVTDSPYYIVPN